jgi:hypothetical protein
MADPTLDTTSTYAGMSVNEMMEEVLKRRGLTLDSDSTGRVEATATEQADVLRYLKRAHTMFNAEWPESYALERATGTWTAGDTAIMLPANASSVLAFWFNGVLALPIEYEDLRRGTYSDEDQTNSMAFYYTGAFREQLYWRISGVANANAVANGGDGLGPVDWRPVLQLYGYEPDDGLLAKPYVIDFVRFGEAFTAGTVPSRVHPVVQEWLISKAAHMWASSENDVTTMGVCMAEMEMHENPIYAAFDSRGDVARRGRWTYPVLADKKRRKT